MKPETVGNLAFGCVGLKFFILIVQAITWIINLVKLVTCDFAEPFKDEILHGVGVFVPLASIVTAWF